MSGQSDKSSNQFQGGDQGVSQHSTGQGQSLESHHHNMRLEIARREYARELRERQNMDAGPSSRRPSANIFSAAEGRYFGKTPETVTGDSGADPSSSEQRSSQTSTLGERLDKLRQDQEESEAQEQYHRQRAMMFERYRKDPAKYASEIKAMLSEEQGTQEQQPEVGEQGPRKWAKDLERYRKDPAKYASEIKAVLSEKQEHRQRAMKLEEQRQQDIAIQGQQVATRVQELLWLASNVYGPQNASRSPDITEPVAEPSRNTRAEAGPSLNTGSTGDQTESAKENIYEKIDIRRKGLSYIETPYKIRVAHKNQLKNKNE